LHLRTDLEPIHAQQETPMERARENQASAIDRRLSREWEDLIRKLRWIGLDDEARRLELAVSTLPPEERGSVSVGPFSTD
jgi:hypothetical protein